MTITNLFAVGGVGTYPGPAYPMTKELRMLKNVTAVMAVVAFIAIVTCTVPIRARLIRPYKNEIAQLNNQVNQLQAKLNEQKKNFDNRRAMDSGVPDAAVDNVGTGSTDNLHRKRDL